VFDDWFWFRNYRLDWGRFSIDWFWHCNWFWFWDRLNLDLWSGLDWFKLCCRLCRVVICLSAMVPIILWKGTVLFIFFDFNWLCWGIVIGENIILVSEYIIVDIE
jgi:hypothetical protein